MYALTRSQLENFWPCPKPLYATLTTDKLEPIPDFVLYQDQAKQLDTLADRIDGFINALKVRGVYDASEPSLARLFSEGENNTLIPVKNYAAFSEKGGMGGAINLVDIAPIAQCPEHGVSGDGSGQGPNLRDYGYRRHSAWSN